MKNFHFTSLFVLIVLVGLATGSFHTLKNKSIQKPIKEVKVSKVDAANKKQQQLFLENPTLAFYYYQ